MLLSIQEPSHSAKQNVAPWKLAVGIDLGTSNTLVSVWQSGQGARCLPDEQGEVLIPSMVHYSAQGEVFVGKEAKQRLASDPKNTIVSVKRFMGRAIADIAQIETYPYDFYDQGSVFGIRTVQGIKTPIDISADILRSVYRRVENHFPNLLVDGLPLPAVITVPAYFDDAQRQATKMAAQLANINVLRLLSEPTAAAVAYGLDMPEAQKNDRDGTFVVYDLGGGTFDVSVLRLERGVFQVISTHGDTALGGDDFDRRLYCWVLDEFRQPPPDDICRRHLHTQVKTAREQLSEVSQTDFSVSFQANGQNPFHTTLTRNKLVALTEDLVDKSLVSVRRAMRDAKISVQEVDGVVLVGGATRMTHVAKAVEKYFRRPPLTGIDPDKIVAEGAARQSALLVGNRESITNSPHLLLDVLPLSLGIETYGGMVERIIPRNTVIPVARSQTFTTGKDGQTAIAIQVVQGEREMVKDCRLLARFELRDIPPMAAGMPRIQVTFQVDADGLLIVSAKDEISSKFTQVEVKPAYGLTPEAIIQLLRESTQMAKEDINLRQLVEQKVAAELMLKELEKAIQEDGALITKEVLEKINTSRICLQEACLGSSIEAIINATHDLNKLIEPFAQDRMNQHIKTVLQGQRLS